MTHIKSKMPYVLALSCGLLCSFSFLSMPVSAQPHQKNAAPSQDDRPYDRPLLRLSEILGAMHYLRALCKIEEGQLWRNQMKELVKAEGLSAVRRVKLVKSFNKGYFGYQRTYRSCTSSAKLAITRFLKEGTEISEKLKKRDR